MPVYSTDLVESLTNFENANSTDNPHVQFWPTPKGKDLSYFSETHSFFLDVAGQSRV